MALSHNLIFLHGWGTDPSVWRYQVEYFSKRYNIETPNLNLVSTINYQLSTILIGWSYGGMLAMEMAATSPKGFKALVLVGCSARFSDGVSPVMVRNIIRNLNRNFEATMRNCYGQFFSNEESVFIDEFIRRQILPDRTSSIELLGKLAAMDLKPILKDISIPTLIIHGDKDNISLLKGGVYLHENLKASRLVVFKGAGHMPFYTRPKEFNEIAEDFIAGVE